MKQSIQHTGQEVSIVIYDAPLPPKYFRLNKKFLRTLFVAIPIVFTLLIAGLFLWGLGSRLQEVPRPTFPTEMSESEAKLAAFEVEVAQLKASNAQLTDKVASSSSVTPNEDPFLMIIKKPYGMQNLINQNLVTADQFELVKEPGKISLKFQIISTTTSDQRVSGHALVFMISNSGTMVYPDEANTSLTEGIKYTQGETFAVARLRPTTAIFKQNLTGKNVKFMIYIFSREGDLLLVKETASFPLEEKN